MARGNRPSTGQMASAKLWNNNEENKKEGGNVNVQNDEKNQQVQTEEHKEQNETEVHANTQGSDNEVTEEANKSSELAQIERTKERRKRLESKMTVEETHTRSTFFVENELLKRLNKVAKKQKRGFKTSFINDAIDELLKDYED